MMKRDKYTMVLRLVTGLFLLFTGSFFFLSCMDEQEITGGDDNKETVVRLTITTPGTTTPSASSRSVVDREYIISDIQVLVFTQEGGKYTFKYMVEGEQLTPDETDGQKTNFIARLKTSLSPIRILVVANAKDAFLRYTPIAGVDEDEVRKNVIILFEGEEPAVLPMYGEKSLLSLDATANQSFTVKMLRAVARVDVEVDLDQDKSKTFVLESVSVYRANGEVQVIPAGTTLSSTETPVVNAPSVPVTVGKAGVYNKRVNALGEKKIEKLYVTEALHTDNPSKDYNKITCVVVGGYYDGGTNPVYYRADFNSGEQGHPYGQVLRNHKYLFKVKQVNGSGWQEPDEAANNRATNMVMEIQAWEDFTMEMYADGEKYLGIDSRELVFGYEAGLLKKVGVQSTVPYKVSWVEGEESITLGEDKTISNGYFAVGINSDTGIDVSYLSVNTLTENDKIHNPSGNNYCSKLKVEWGNWIFYIDVQQLHVTYYVKDPSKMRSMKILSTNINGTGQLGTANYGATGVGMRKLLENPDYFSEEGVVDYLSGISFNATYRDGFLYADPNSTNATYRSYANRVKTEVYAADVIYLNNDNAVGPYAAEVILEWLDSSPNRVLIVGCDNANTSNALLQELPNRGYEGLLRDEVDFWYNAGAGTSYQTDAVGYDQHFFLIHDDRDRDREVFYNGPFGKVAENTQFHCVDYYYGFTKSYDEKKVLPLVYHKNAISKGYNSMSIGVNRERKIIYFGDASLWDEGVFNKNYAGANGTTGKITTDVQRFWANMWAWIAHQVIWGE